MNKILLLLAGFFLCVAAYGQNRRLVVAQDGTGDYKTVQEAINAVPDFRKVTTVIYLKKGIYREKIILAGSKKMVSLVGEDVTSTVLCYDDFATKKNAFGEEKGTSGSSSCYLYGDDFHAENLTFQNTSGPVGQAVALFVAGDRSSFSNCRFLGFQDTLYTYGVGSRQYYTNCYIEGTVDFIFGAATAVFNECTVYCKKGGGYITAASTPDTSRYGYVFLNCKIVGDAPENSFYLGRPWRPFAKTVFINCSLGKMIHPAGWNNWGKESNEKTAFYAEYNNIGPGARPAERARWSHQLTPEEAAAYSISTVLQNWEPHAKK